MRYGLCTRWLLAGLVLLCSAAQASEPERITSIEGITEYRLDNGMLLLLMPDESRPTFTINATYFVGSKHENYGETGMAHLLEHMLFYGTPNHPDVKQEISERGGWANGTTWFDRTNYFQTMPAGDENLQWAIAMEADRMVNSVIDAEDLRTEMTVVRNEYEGGENNPFRVLLQRVSAVAYMWHGYGRSTIGARSDLENVPVERLHAFYRKHYQPDNAMLVLSGNFDEARALELAQQHFGAIPAPVRTGDNILWPTYTREPVQDGEREVVVRRVGEIQIALAAFHVPAGTHEDFPAISVLGYVLGDMPSGRLYKSLVESELATRVGSFPMRLAEPGQLFIFAEVRRDQDIERVKTVLLETIDDLAVNPPTTEEVTRAINASRRSIEQTMNDTERVGISLSEWASNGDWRLMYLFRDRIEAVTEADVARVAAAYLKPSNRTLGFFIPDASPDRSEIPEATDIAAALDGYTGRAERTAGTAFSTTADNIEAHVTRFELANGAQVVLLPKPSRGGRVNMEMVMRTGDEASLTGQGRAPHATAAMLNRGTTSHTRQQISDRLDELHTTLNIRGQATDVSASVESIGEQIADVIDLLADMLKNPVFPQRELEEWQRQELASIDLQRTEPGAVAVQTLEQHTNIHASDHPHYVPDFDERAELTQALDRDRIVDFHERFYGFGPGTTLTLVGDFDPVAVRRQLETLFDDWTSPNTFTRIARTYNDFGAVELEALTPDKPNAVLIAMHPIRVRDDHADYPALVLGGYMLGGGFLAGRLPKRIRDAEGISYGVSARFHVPPIDDTGSFSIWAMYNPENRERLRIAIEEELALALADGFAEDEIDSAKRGWLQQQATLRADDGRLARQLNNDAYLARDAHYQEALEAQVAALTADEILDVLRRRLDPARLLIVEAGDF